MYDVYSGSVSYQSLVKCYSALPDVHGAAARVNGVFGRVTVIVFLLNKSIDVMLFVSFIHSLFYHIHHDV